ncbi:peptidoglycan recognition protein family protein [Schleiferilactobacillus shenzhenensis]|uniref:Atl n=1 Tax=Schleiferilactobacillus shenzhenensis LY-73 TaxID=1231336 RepID=U4TWT7_9LACO|nr:peptidoglycan recognition family protein [Schleiferilactobacillus shenzhenensis]ERL66293.1 Atl [Schleiferilactobacillus shenzhenensis LY-73]
MKKRYLIASLVCAGMLATAALPSLARQYSYTSSAIIQDVAVDNNYINAQHFANPPIITKATTFTHMNGYRNGVGKPEGVVIHETSDPDMTLDEEVTRMQTQWQKRQAYVHAFVNHEEVVNIHPTDYAVWGAGYYANQRFIQIELVEEHTAVDFAHSVNNDAYYVATLLKHYNLPADLADNDGQGTIWSHNAVSQYLGDTNHTDPEAYFASWHYSMDQFAALVQQKLAAMNGTSNDQVAEKTAMNDNGTITGSATKYYLTDSGFTAAGSTSALAGQRYRITSKATTTSGNTMYLAANAAGAGLFWIPANGVTLGGSTPDNNGGPTAFRGVGRINYVPHYGIAVWRNEGSRIAGKYLPHGSSWQLFGKKTVNGVTWYNVGGDQWISGQYVVLQ